MMSNWKTYLENAGAVIENNVVVHFGNITEEMECVTDSEVISDLSHMGLISAHGDDSQMFLQGQLTNDVLEVNTQHSQLTGYCSPKGRLLALIRLFYVADRYYMQLPADILSAILKRLGMFVLRSQVTLEDASDSLIHAGLSGPESGKLLEDTVGVLPQDVDQVAVTDRITVIRIPGIQPRFELFGRPDDIKTLWEKLREDARPVGTAAWRRLNILAGIPAIYTQTMDMFVPQMVNLQAFDGINYKKGCYTGQEVVARLHYRGNLKRRMYIAHTDSAIAPQPGDTLYSPNAGSAEGAGMVVDAEADPAGGYDVLVVIRIPYAESDEVRLYDDKGAKLQFQRLPYGVD